MELKEASFGHLKQFTLDLLKNNDTSKYFIEYNGYFSNHLADGIIALYRIGAAEKYFERYVENHVGQLEKPSRGPTQRNQEVNLRWNSYYEILGSYRYKLQHKYGGSITLLVAQEFPKLIHMTSGAALHGVIHLGYGFSILDEATTCEGLAYLKYAGSPFNFDAEITQPIESFGHGSKDIIEVLKYLSEIYPKQFKNYLNQEVSKPWIADSHRSKFQSRMKVLLQNDGNTIMGYVNEIEIPSHLLDESNLHSLLDWLLDTTIILYLVSDQVNDFFLLHGVSSTWSLIQILTNAFPQEKRKTFAILRIHLGVLLATYIAQEAPAIDENTLMKDTDELEDVSWLQIKSKLLDELPKESDDHVYKLVQICYETARKFDHKSKMELVYKKAAMTVMLNSFKF